jgi:hypothetical protein
MSDVIERPNVMQSFVERVVCDPSIDVNKLEQVFALQERVADREARRRFAEAMNALQREMPQVTKDAISQNRRYATYEAVDAAIRPYYTKHGFSVSFTVHAANNRIRVGCKVKHVGNHEETEHELESGPDMSGARGQATKTEVQGVGSVVTYLKRYTIMAAFAVALQDDETDDDGEATRRDRQAASAYPSGRDAINRDVPLVDSTAPKGVRTDFLDSLEIAMRACGSLAEVNRLIAQSRTQDALAAFRNGHLARLNAIIGAGVAAHAPVASLEPAEEDVAKAAADAAGWPGPMPSDFRKAEAPA